MSVGRRHQWIVRNGVVCRAGGARLFTLLVSLVLVTLVVASARGDAPGAGVSLTTTPLSVAVDGGPANGSSGDESISADGSVAAFDSDASNLVVGDTNGRTDVFVVQPRQRGPRRISVGRARVQAPGVSRRPAVSPDGRYVAHTNDAGAGGVIRPWRLRGSADAAASSERHAGDVSFGRRHGWLVRDARACRVASARRHSLLAVAVAATLAGTASLASAPAAAAQRSPRPG